MNFHFMINQLLQGMQLHLKYMHGAINVEVDRLSKTSF